MTIPPDLAAFITMLLRGSQLTAQSLLVGGLAFLALLARPLAPVLGGGGALVESCRRWTGRAGLALAVIAALAVAVNILNLTQTLDLSFQEALGADFIFWTGLAVLGGVNAWLWLKLAKGPVAAILLLASAAMAMLATLMSSHASARLQGRDFFMTADFLHQLGAGIWIGGIPFLLLALRKTSESGDKAKIGLRFSHMSIFAVATLALGATMMAIGYSGSWAAAVGTAYGAMMATKLALLGILLLLGLMNLLSTSGNHDDPGLTRLSGFAEVEIGIGVAVIFMAASLASSPPAADQALDPTALASFSEIVERLTPHWPRLVSPSHDLITIPGQNALAYTSSDIDKAWSEVNHHWAGLFLLTLSILTILERTGKAPWAKHWPLMFLLMAVMLFIRSDPESWPLGPLPFWERFLDPETAQHRLVMMLLVPFGFFEWSVRTGRLTANWAKLVFPGLCALGGTLLLAHTHSLTDVKQSYLIEITHLPMGAFGILAGWGRWLEIRGRGWPAKLGGWTWPISFTMVALLLIDYRET
jgi:putative copper resistance protein D